MDINTDIISAEYQQYEHAVSIIGNCTDDYLFYFDLDDNYFSISESVLDKYALPTNKFHDAIKILKTIVHPDDFMMVVDEFKKLRTEVIDVLDLECRWIDRKGHISWINCRCKAIVGADGTSSHIIGRVTELGERKRADNITGFRTHILFQRDFTQLIETRKSANGFIMRMGIDNFREVNERFGHETGDNLLRIFSKCLINVVPSDVKIYRMEGDEFALLFINNFSEKDVIDIYEAIKKEAAKYEDELEYKIFFTVSAGVIAFPENASSYEEVYRKSEFTLNSAKKLGKNNIYIYNQNRYDEHIEVLELQEALRLSVKNDFEGFEVYYQPIVECGKKEVAGAEALLRWNNKKYGSLSPVKFVPLLEDTGLIIPVGRFVYITAIRQCAVWMRKYPDFRMHINLSNVQLRKSDIINDITDYINECGINPANIIIELTESGEIDLHGTVRESVDGIAKNGEGLAIDDFGTGYSNLRYLKEMKVNTIKIDRAFVMNSTDLGFDYKLIKHIIDLAHSADMKICLEGVETTDQLEVLSELNPDYIQGFFFGKPVNAATFAEKFVDK